MQDPTAMTLASVDAHGRPSARVVLFKGFHGDGLDRGLTFYTNYESRKGRELADHPNVALVFWWDKLARPVRLEGRVSKLPPQVSGRYFHSPLPASQLVPLTSRPPTA